LSAGASVEKMRVAAAADRDALAGLDHIEKQFMASYYRRIGWSYGEAA
jgi:hypothetical protein